MNDQASWHQRFPELSDLAIRVMGSKEEADRWFVAPNMFLEQHSPQALTSSAEGVAQLEIYLKRLDLGVYA